MRAPAERSPTEVGIERGEVIASRYRVEALLDEGPHGVVFRAHDSVLSVDVALKWFFAELFDGPGARDRFRERADEGRRLSHPSLVRVNDEGVWRERPFLVSTRVLGVPLRRILMVRERRKKRFGAREVEPIVGQLAAALATTRGRPHTDLVPENVLVLPDLLKLTDFGLGSALDRPVFLEAQGRAGRLGYVAPEVRRGAPFSPSTDVWSVGALCLELLGGQRPGEAPGKQLEALAAGKLTGDKLRGGLESVLARCFEPADRRHETLEGLHAALRDAMGLGALAPVGKERSGPIDRTEPVDQAMLEAFLAEAEERSSEGADPDGARRAVPSGPRRGARSSAELDEPSSARTAGPRLGADGPARTRPLQIARGRYPTAWLVLLVLLGSILGAGLTLLMVRLTSSVVPEEGQRLERGLERRPARGNEPVRAAALAAAGCARKSDERST